MVIATRIASRISPASPAERSFEDESRGWLSRELGHLCSNAEAVRRALPNLIFVYLCAIYLLLALFVWWVPVCDFDTMSSYLARIQLERIGPLRETGTLELQYLFPKFFDYLHAPLLDWGWFTTLPNFALFTAVLLAAIRRFPTAVAVRFILGLAICSPVLAGATSAKNDITLGLIGLLCWFWIYYSKIEKPWYLPVTMLFAAALIGTKWHGLVLAPVFMVMASVRVLCERAFRWASVLMLFSALPLAWYISSADVYLENFQHDGTICPRPDFLKQDVSVSRNAWSFGVNQLLETLEVPFYCSDAYLNTKFWPLLKRVTISGKAWNYAAMPNSHLAVYGLPLLFVIAASLVALMTRRLQTPIRACAFLAIAYWVVVLVCFHYTAWINRYFLPTYLFGLVPTAYLTQRMRLRGVWKCAFYAYLIFVSAQTTLLNQEKRVLPFKLYVAETNQFNPCATIFDEKLDRESLFCHVWSGFVPLHRQYRERVQSHHQLLIVNSMTGGNVPFIYPFIRGRTANNTRVVNVGRGQSLPLDLMKYDFILAFPGDFNHPSFKPWLQNLDIAVYKKEG